MAWVSPTGFIDPSNAWSWETWAYDNDLETAAETQSETAYLELTLGSAISCDKVRIYAADLNGGLNDPELDIDVFYDGAYHNIFSGVITKEVWVEKSIGSTETVSKARVRMTDAAQAWHFVIEFDFWEVEAGEEKLLTATCSATSSTIGSLTLGKIESLTATSATATNVPSTTLQLLYSITAHAPPAISVTGSLSVVKSLAGTSSVASSTQGSLTVGKVEALTATSDAISIATGSLTLGKIETLSSTAEASTSASGSLTILRIIFLSGTASVSSSVSSPNIRLLRQIAGTSSITSSTQGSLTLGKVEVLSGTVAITSSTQGSLTLGKVETLRGTASAQSSTTAQLCVLWVLSATSGAVSIITGSLTVINLVKLMKKLIQLEEIEV